MQPKNKILLGHVLGLTVVGLVALCVIWFGRGGSRMFSERELNAMELYVHNVHDSALEDDNLFYPVDEREICEQIAIHCREIVEFRPLAAGLDAPEMAEDWGTLDFIFINPEERYKISFVNVREQRDFQLAGRGDPLLVIEKSVRQGNEYISQGVWYATLDMQHYVELYQLGLEWPGKQGIKEEDIPQKIRAGSCRPVFDW